MKDTLNITANKEDTKDSDAKKDKFADTLGMK